MIVKTTLEHIVLKAMLNAAWEHLAYMRHLHPAIASTFARRYRSYMNFQVMNGQHVQFDSINVSCRVLYHNCPTRSISLLVDRLRAIYNANAACIIYHFHCNSMRHAKLGLLCPHHEYISSYSPSSSSTGGCGAFFLIKTSRSMGHVGLSFNHGVMHSRSKR